MRRVDEIFNSMIGKGGSSAPYTYYDYLETDERGQWIDTGITLNGGGKIVIDYFEYANTAAIFGSTNETSLAVTTSNKSNYLLIPNNRTYEAYGTGGTGYVTNTKQPNTAFSYAMEIVGNKMVFTMTRLSDSTTYVRSQARQIFDCVSTMAIFGIHGKNDTILYLQSGVKIGRVKRYDDNNDLILDCRPAVRSNDGKNGYHELITDTFKASVNGENFLYGNL